MKPSRLFATRYENTWNEIRNIWSGIFKEHKGETLRHSNLHGMLNGIDIIQKEVKEENEIKVQKSDVSSEN